MSFIILTKDQFEEILPKEFQIEDLPNIKEIVYSIPTENSGINVRIYSTVDTRTNQTREKGQDAIRIIFWDTKNDRPLGKGKKVLRVEGKTTIQERIKSRIEEFMKDASNQEIVNFKYVEFILRQSSSNFARNLLGQLKEIGSLTDGQLVYILGEESPKGWPTFEANVKKQNPEFMDNYLQSLEEENEDPKKTTEEDKKSKTEGGSQKEEGNLGLERQGDRSEDSNSRARDNDRELDARLDVGSCRAKEIKLVPTKDYSPHQYPWEFFNPVQSQVIRHIEENRNLVIGSNTSTGKTECAELLIDYTLSQGKRCIYLSPLKSLTQEKYDAWQKRFPDQTITILTGDYFLSDEMKIRLKSSNIIVLTSEMADSRTRKFHSEKNYWLSEVGLVIVDESHILSTSRGHAVEAGIMRFTRLNPEARVLFLSATMPNVGELGTWLTLLNGKETTVIFSQWRPVELQMHYKGYQIQTNNYGREDYWASQMKKRSMAVEIVLSKPDEKFLVFCHDKATGRDIVKRLKTKGVDTIFHNADLGLNERLEIERSFQNRSNGIRVLVSTSTLAWGRNLPARNVVIVGIHRGIDKVDEYDIIQMSGRAGRYGIDDEGHVYLIIPEGTTRSWQEIFKNPRPVTSVLNDHQVLAFHVLAEIENKEVKSVSELMRWYSRSLASMQNMKPFTKDDARGLIEDLDEMEMITQQGIIPYITGLGKVSAWFYFSPWDVYGWYKNFCELFGKGGLVQGVSSAKFSDDPVAKTFASGKKPLIELSDESLSWAIASIPKNDPRYTPKDLMKQCEEWSWLLKNREIRLFGHTIPSIIATHQCLVGQKDEKNSLLKALKKSVIFDIDRSIQAISLIDDWYAKWKQEELWKILPSRIKYGIPQEMVPLTKIPGIGGVRARKLWEIGFTSVEDVADLRNKRKLLKIFQPTMVTKVQEAARRL